MLTLLHPSALLALLGLSVPVAIHLWNRRPGREVAVGSLRWLAAGANRRLRNLKPEQLWLLLLRAALLAALAVAVAGPVWRQAQPAGRGVVLLSAEAARLPALTGLQPTIHSLRRKGYELRWLAAGFPKVPGSAWKALAAGHPSGAADSVTAGRPREFAWARVQQAAGTFAGQPLFVVTSAKLHSFRGSHPVLPATVSWQILPDTSTTSWLAAAETVGDSLQLLVGRSSETQTTYRRNKVLKQHNGQLIQVAGLPPVRLQPDKSGGNNLVLVPATASPQSTEEVGVAVGPMVIEVYATAEYAADARYLEAALRAAAVGLPIPPLLHRVTALPKHLNANWTFWLSDEPLPSGWQEGLKKNAHTLWQEATGPGMADTAQLVTTEALAVPATVFRRDTGLIPQTAVPVWADGLGRPILTRQNLGAGTRYHLHTRLSPTWSELANDPNLPARLLALLQPELANESAAAETPVAQAEAAHDQRALAPAQLLPGGRRAARTPLAAPQSAVIPVAFRTTDLRPWLVLLVGLLFLFERLLARRREARAYSTTTP